MRRLHFFPGSVKLRESTGKAGGLPKGSYFDKLKEISKAAESKRLIDLIAFEVNEMLDAQDSIAGGGK